MSVFASLIPGIFFFFGSLAEAQVGASTREEPIVRVRLGEAQESVRVRGYDLKANQISLGDRQSEWEVRCVRGSVELRSIGNPDQKGVPASHAQAPHRSLLFASPGGFLKWGGLQVRDQLRIVPNAKQSHRCDVINELHLEKYLVGVINGEFNSKWAPEAIRAQVIAARTYALNEMQRNSAANFDLESTVKDQVYDGSHKEDHLAARAVEATRGKVLVAESDLSRPLRSFYHSTCGGETELPEKVWGKPFPGFKKRVSCSFCKSSPKYRWKVEISRETLQKKLGIPGAPGSASLVLEKGEGGRVKRVKWVPAQGMPRVFSGVEFRKRLGTQEFPSARFEVTSNGSSFAFEGGGYGHGVGLCQWGAKVMGERGFTHSVILKHYFPDAQLVSWYP